jgi:hypothetical protein
MKHATLSTDGTSSALSYSEEDGKQYVGQHMNLDPHIAAVKARREVNETATKASNPNGWKHEARVPIPVITDWCRKNGYTFDQFARNEDKAKDKFMRWFNASREFSKLVNNNTLNKKKSSQVTVPQAFLNSAVDLSGIGQ